MSVNGIEIEVGQKWRTRYGALVTIDSIYDHHTYPVNVGGGTCRTLQGKEWVNEDSDRDLIELIEGAPKAEQPAEDGWIEWGGGQRPVPSNTCLEIRLRNGHQTEGRADQYRWGHDDVYHDIVAYRVISEVTPTQDADTLASETLQALGWHFDGMGWVQDESTPIKSALDVQEGGNHYKSLGIQPVEYIEQNKLDYFQGNVVKYITRHKAKNGIEDVKKAAHYCQLIIELQYGKAGV